MPDPPPETASSQPQQIDTSNSDTISLISSLLDAKLQKTFGDFKRSLDEREVETRCELKQLVHFNLKVTESSLSLIHSSLTALIWLSLICPRETC